MLWNVERGKEQGLTYSHEPVASERCLSSRRSLLGVCYEFQDGNLISDSK
jgi:hypothetical protein